MAHLGLGLPQIAPDCPGLAPITPDDPGWPWVAPFNHNRFSVISFIKNDLSHQASQPNHESRARRNSSSFFLQPLIIHYNDTSSLTIPIGMASTEMVDNASTTP